MSATQWTGQIPPSFAKWGVCSGCQSWVKTTVAPLFAAIAISRLTVGMMAVAAGHAQPTGRVGEVVLDVDHDERRVRVVALHDTRVSQGAIARRYPMSVGSSSRSDSTAAFESAGCGGSTSSR